MANKIADNFKQLSENSRIILSDGISHFIDGKWEDGNSEDGISIVDPSTGQRICRSPDADNNCVDKAVGAARRQFDSGVWRRMTPEEREGLIHKLANLIEQHAGEFTELEILNCGMMRSFAELNVFGAVGVLRYMAGWPTKICGRTANASIPIPGSKFFSCTVKEPVGVVGAIIPWNAPLMITIWKLAPALATGCTVVIKPAENTPLSAMLLSKLIKESGIPDGVVNIIYGYGTRAGSALSAHPGVNKITFTGSSETGKKVGHAAIDSYKRLTLELGGKSPAIIFDDADIDAAIPSVSNSIFMNAGQVCVAGSRLYVQSKNYESVVEGVAEYAKKLKLGSGFENNSDLGPLISETQRERVKKYIQSGEKEGAQKVIGGECPDQPGYYIEPTVFTDVNRSMTIMREEIFGPVLAVQPFDEPEEVVELANDNPYGLAAFVWTNDINRMNYTISRLQAGTVWVNMEQAPHPMLPGGGYKSSGFGRDLGQEALDHFLETKSVFIRTREIQS